MGLDVSVGALSNWKQMDPDAVAERRAHLRVIDESLSLAGYASHGEPDDLPDLTWRIDIQGFPYGCLGLLRRLYALNVEGRIQMKPSGKEVDDVVGDLAVRRITSNKHHLLLHSDVDGYYVPI